MCYQLKNAAKILCLPFFGISLNVQNTLLKGAGTMTFLIKKKPYARKAVSESKSGNSLSFCVKIGRINFRPAHRLRHLPDRIHPEYRSCDDGQP